jgi:predicted  nucleic acid-binding Zn-ribbon protein
MTQQIDPKQLQQSIRATVSNLQALGEVEDGRTELAKVQREIDVEKRNLAGIKTEFAEVKRAHDKILGEAHEKQRELERTEAELKAKSAELANVTNALSKIRQQLGG